MIQLGLVGVGAWGRRLLATLHARDDCRVVAVSRRTSAAFDPELGEMRQYPSWRDLIADSRWAGLDGLVVATTPGAHGDIASAAIGAGLPVLVEKPLALSRTGVQQVVSAAAAADPMPPVMIDYVHLWAPPYRALKARLSQLRDSGDQIDAILASGGNRGPYREWSPLYDYGPHDLAFVWDLLGLNATIAIDRASLATDERGGELYSVELRSGPVGIHVSTGNGAVAKVRTLSIRLRSGTRLVYDDLRSHPAKATEDDAAISYHQAPPLDEVVNEFLRRVDQWQHRQPSSTYDLSLSLHIAEILDDIQARTRAQESRKGRARD